MPRDVCGLSGGAGNDESGDEISLRLSVGKNNRAEGAQGPAPEDFLLNLKPARAGFLKLRLEQHLIRSEQRATTA
jgi:hypothetical protein